MAVTHVMTSCNVPPQKARTAFSWFTPSALSLSMAGPKSSRHDRVSTGRAQFFSLSAPARFLSLSRQLWNHFISFYSALLRQTDRFPNTPPCRPPACAIIEKSPVGPLHFPPRRRAAPFHALKLRLLPRRIYKSGDSSAAAPVRRLHFLMHLQKFLSTSFAHS